SAIYRNYFTTAINNILHPTTMQRITDSRLYGNQYPLTEVVNDLVKAVFDADLKTNVSTYRQYIQIMLTDRLINLSMGNPSVDLVAKATLLHALRIIKTKLQTAVTGHVETKIHRAGLLFKINEALEIK